MKHHQTIVRSGSGLPQLSGILASAKRPTLQSPEKPVTFYPTGDIPTAGTEKNMARSFLVLDDHPFVHTVLVRLLAELEPGGRVAVAHRLDQALSSLRDNPAPDLILADLHLPDGNGTEVLARLRQQRPECPIAVFSAAADSPTILRCLEAGAIGYIPKTHSNEAVLNALRLINSGCPYVPPEVLIQTNGRTRLEARLGSAPSPRHLGLTDRQIDVLRLILRGLPNKLICRNLQLAEGTVKVHVSAVLRALGVRNRTQAVIAASRIGLEMRD